MVNNMNESISKQLSSLLNEYCTKIDGVLGAGISTSSGLEISSNFNKKVDPNLAHAISSSMYHNSQQSAESLGFDGFNYNLTYTEKGIIALQKVNKNTAVMVLMEPGTNVVHALTEMKDFVKKVDKLI
jgi:predicted regulator of Ras-like GTPase activity (Roadblock/LC7/MglB family)